MQSAFSFFIFSYFFFQNQLSREKEELEAEKRDLVRTSERRSQEVEHLNGITKNILTNWFI